MKIKGIDISSWQGNIDFKKVKASGIDFVIIRAGYGRFTSQKDEYFEQNYKNAKAAGLNVGAYWYSYAESTADAIKEAKTCLSVIKGKKFEFPIYFDLEESSQFTKGRAFCDGLVKAFCGEMEKAGYWAGLYISRSPLQNYISQSVAKRYALWVAEYGDKCNYSGSYGIWQYSSTGKIGGISGNCDADYCYIDYPKLIKEKGFNGYKSGGSTSKKPKKVNTANEKKTVTYTVKKGDTLSAIAEKYHTTVSRLVKDNDIKNADLIYPNQKIVIK
ncbi:MAG: GH25 family lysozyme [Oscillospiraceae bacterium]